MSWNHHREHSEGRAHHPHGPRAEPQVYGDREGFAREDFVSDEDFEKMVASGSFEKKSSHVIGPEDYEDYTPNNNASHRPAKPFEMIGPEDYGEPASPIRHSPDPTQDQQSHHHHHPFHDSNPQYLTPTPERRYDPPPYPPGTQDPSRPYGYSSGAGPSPARDDEEPTSFSMPLATVSGRPVNPYEPPADAPLGYDNVEPAQGYGVPGRHGGGRPPQGQPHQYSHIPELAAVHDQYTDPGLYYEAAQQLHSTPSQQPHYAPAPSNDHYFAAHAQAYGPASEQLNAPMDADAIGAAAAVQALKMSAEQNQLQPNLQQIQSKPHPTHQVQTEFDSSSSQPTWTGHAAAQKPQPTTELTSENDNEVPTPSAVIGGHSPQDKIIALAMAQAGKLFDKKNGGSGNSDAKVQAIHAAGATALRLCGEYRSTGKVNLQPGEMQQLIAAAMSLF